MAVPEHTVWVLLFEQTPPVLRWILAVLTGGIFLLLQQLYRNHKERVNRLENLIITNQKTTTAQISGVHKKIDTLTVQLLRNRGD
ncbi:MAG TPA: hypothetical protein ENJ28_04855 [Gammaproteobacteria bacterium]|nr:hypothetical protein [Gammaproteobacteria bacterium]